MNVGLQETTDAFEQHGDKAETPKPSEFAHDLGRGPCGLLSVSNADQRCHTSRHAVPKGTFSNVGRCFWSSQLGLLLACREEAKAAAQHPAKHRTELSSPECPQCRGGKTLVWTEDHLIGVETPVNETCFPISHVRCMRALQQWECRTGSSLLARTEGNELDTVKG